jgi:DnaA family protein
MMNMNARYAQLPLGVRLRESATFANYYTCASSSVVTLLEEGVLGGLEPCVYLWGGVGCGKTHLLHALCHAAAARGLALFYLPLAETGSLAPELLEDLDSMDVVCIDDIHAVAGQAAWETALFHLYNRLRDQRRTLVVTASVSPAALPLTLADLRSRLAWGPVVQLQVLNDADKTAALQLRARGRGLELPTDVANYLLRRCPRDMHRLFALLDQLDIASLSAQRRLTIPFVRDALRID